MRFLGLLALLGCGAAPAPWPEDVVVEAPLVAAWRAERPLIEVRIDDRSPVLMVVDPGTSGVEVAREYAHRLGLPPPRLGRGAPRVTGHRVNIGGVEAPLDLTISDVAPPAFQDRPVVGVVGRAAFLGHVLTVDPGRGLVTIGAEPAPRPAIPLEGWALPLAFGDVTAAAALSFRNALGQLTERTGARAKLTGQLGHAGRVAWFGAAQFAGLPARPLAYGVSADLDRTGYRLFQDLVVQIDARLVDAPTFAAWPAPAGVRTTLAPDCGDDGHRCIMGAVSAVSPARVELTFEEPPSPLPAGVWARVALGPHDGLSILVQLRPRPHGVLRTAVKIPPLPAEYALSLDDPVKVVDFVRLGADCPGEVCLIDPRLHPIFPR